MGVRRGWAKLAFSPPWNLGLKNKNPTKAEVSS